MPAWLTWDLKATVFPPRTATAIRPAGSNPPAEVHYNPSASAYIRDKLFGGARLQAMLDTHVPVDFPRDSIAVKAVWWLIAKRTCIAVPVWNHKGKEERMPADRFQQKYWPDKVQVCAPDAPRQKIDAAEPLSHFYSVALSGLDKPERDSLDPEYPGDQVSTALLLGLDFTTKEQPDWFWGTLWWHREPDMGPYGSDRPPGLFTDQRWNNYRLDVAADEEEPRQENGLPKATFNPYLELTQLLFGNHSNCMSCHSRAFWSGTDLTANTVYCASEVDRVEPGSKVPLSLPRMPGLISTLVTEGKGFSLRCDNPTVDPIHQRPVSFQFSDYLPLDFIWSLSSVRHDSSNPGADPPPINPPR